jgi:Domain of unknown function (DUF4124)
MEGTIKGLALVGASALAVVAVWAVLEKGAFLSRFGSPPPAPVQSSSPPHPATAFNSHLFPQPAPLSVRPPAPKGMVTIYKWVDANGGVHFSDRPLVAQSEAMAVGQVQTVSMPTSTARPGNVLAALSSAGHLQRRISAEDYHFISYASQRGDAVVFSGRVEFGPSCGRLQLTVQGSSNHGQRIAARTVVENAGAVSKLWEAKRFVGLSRGALPVWEVVGIQADCLD